MRKRDLRIFRQTQWLTLAGMLVLSPILVQAQENNSAGDAKDSVSKMSQSSGSTLIKTVDEAFTAMRDVRAARLAIFNGNTELAGQLVDNATQNLQTAHEMMSDYAIPSDSSSSDQQQASAGQQGSGQQQDSGQQQAAAQQQESEQQQSSGNSGKTYIPFDLSILVAEGYVPNSEKDAAVAEANKSLAEGDQQKAVDTLRLADVDVAVAAAVIPAEASVNHVQKASELIGNEQYYEANVALKAIEDSVLIRTFAIDAVPVQGASGSDPSGTQDGSSSQG